MDPLTAFALNVGKTLLRNPKVQGLILTLTIIQIGALALVVLAPMWMVTTMAGGARSSSQQPTDGGTCETSATTTTGQGQRTMADLNSEQIHTAQQIYAAAAHSRLGGRAAIIAIAVAAQESDLGAHPGIERPNGDGDAGVFQQRTKPGWYGTLAQINNLNYATRIFLQGRKLAAADIKAAKKAGSEPAGPAGYTIPGLAQIEGWQKMSVTGAAQAVQRSGFSNAYADHERLARQLVNVFGSKTNPDTQQATQLASGTMCGEQVAANCPPSGSTAETGLLPDALRVIRCVKQQWPQIASFGGVGPRPANVDDDHQTGRAVDIMIPSYGTATGQVLGKTIATWAVKQREQLGLKYVIWNAHIWSVERAKEGWRQCGGPAARCYNGPDDTAAHRDHVHISTYGNIAGSVDTHADSAAASNKIILPVSGNYVLTAGFGQCAPGVWANCHTGQDFAQPAGKPIRATMDGTITAITHVGSYGNLTKIQHANGVESWYGHQLRQNVTVGQHVTAGQQIGQVGYTGNVRPAGPQGAHLHLEIRKNGRPVDPQQWLKDRGVL